MSEIQPEENERLLRELLRETEIHRVDDWIKCSMCRTTKRPEEMYVSPSGGIACAVHAFCRCGHSIAHHESKWNKDTRRYENSGKCSGRFKHWSKSKKKIRRKFCKCIKPILVTKQFNPDEPLPPEAKNDPKYKWRST